MIATKRARLRTPQWHLHAPASALFLWACLWLNLNSSFFDFQIPHTLDDWQLLCRAILPFAVLPVATLILLCRRIVDIPGLIPSKLLVIYGVLAGIAAVFSPQPTWSLYWSLTFLATIASAWTFANTRSPVPSTRQMLQVTWAVTFVFASIIAYVARDVVFSGNPLAYVDVAANLSKMSRASGVARWAAVPGLVCTLKAYHTRRPVLIPFFVAIASVAFYIVYRMQSRGAVFGSVAALIFALFTSSRLRRYALPCAVFAGLMIAILVPPARLYTSVTTYLERGQSEEEFRSMTGRTRAYENGIAAFWDAPMLGRGQWADRLIIGEHSHNSYIQAFLNAGILGGIPYVASWIAGWILFLRLQERRHLLHPEDQAALLEAGTVMMFFTVRSFPETTTASYAADLLIMAAVYVYLETLTVATVRRSLPRSVRTLLQTGAADKPRWPQMIERPQIIRNPPRQ